MVEKIKTIKFSEYESADELPQADRELFCEAVEALKGSYAPYSNFNVGAAVRLAGGIIVRGANQENSAYPSGLCAERVAMFSAAARYPEQALEAIAIVASQSGKLQPAPSYPCGACLQVMAQYETKFGNKIHIIVGSGGSIQVLDGVASMMPFIFTDI